MSRPRRSASPRAAADETSEKFEEAVNDTKKFIDKAVGEIGKESAARNALLGSLSGWFAGFIAMKIGKFPGFAVGSGAVLLHFAHQNGFINLDWDRIVKKVDKISDKMEKEATGSKPGWTEKAERFIDRKLDKAEDLLKKKQLKAKKWYHSVTGDEYYRATETHVFLASFVAGLAIGLMCGR